MLSEFGSENTAEPNTSLMPSSLSVKSSFVTALDAGKTNEAELIGNDSLPAVCAKVIRLFTKDTSTSVCWPFGSVVKLFKPSINIALPGYPVQARQSKTHSL